MEKYGIKDFEDALKICTDKGFNPYEIVKGVQPICFENAAWAYTLGAAIATICAETMVTLVQFIFARKIIDYRFVLKRSVIYVANSIVMTIPVVLCIFFIKIEWLTLIVGIVTGAFVYLVMLIVEKNQFVMNIFNSIKLRLKH